MNNKELIGKFYRNYFWVLLALLLLSIYDSTIKSREIEEQKIHIANLIEVIDRYGQK